MTSPKRKPDTDPNPRPNKQARWDGIGKTTGTRLPKETDLADRFFALGQKLKVSKGSVPALPDLPGHRKAFFAKIEAKPDVFLGNVKFGSYYRSVFPYMDEILATAATREYLAGYFEAEPDSEGERKNAKNLFENLSKRSRVPTHIIGYATATERMQHPTSIDDAVFADHNDTASAHKWLDRERKLVAVIAGENESNEKGATKETVLKAMLAAAAVFTLNYMAAPATAKDIRPFGLRTKGEKIDDLTDYVWEREQIKHLALSLGATEADEIPDERGRGRLKRRWDEPGKDKREVSPARLTKGKKVFPDPVPVAAAAFPPVAGPHVTDFPPSSTAAAGPQPHDPFSLNDQSAHAHVEALDLSDFLFAL